MADSMSFDKYIDNPSGGASVVTNRKMYKDMYKAKFDAVLVREQGTIKYYVYHDTDNTDSYYIHMKIPSEVIDNFYYDVVITAGTLWKILVISYPKNSLQSMQEKYES